MQTEDEQAFLARQQQLLQQQGQVPMRGDSPLRSQAATGKPRTSTGTGGSPKKVNIHLDPSFISHFIASLSLNFQMDVKVNPGTPSGEGVLANFFNSLLTKKTGSPAGVPSLGATQIGGAGGGSPRTPNGTDNMHRQNAAEELDRLTKNVKKDLDFSQQSDC